MHNHIASVNYPAHPATEHGRNIARQGRIYSKSSAHTTRRDPEKDGTGVKDGVLFRLERFKLKRPGTATKAKDGKQAMMTFTDEVSKCIDFVQCSHITHAAMGILPFSCCVAWCSQGSVMHGHSTNCNMVTWDLLPCLSCVPTTLICYRRVV